MMLRKGTTCPHPLHMFCDQIFIDGKPGPCACGHIPQLHLIDDGK